MTTSQKPRINYGVSLFLLTPRRMGKFFIFLVCYWNIDHDSSQGCRSTISSLKIMGHHEFKVYKRTSNIKPQHYLITFELSWKTSIWSPLKHQEEGSKFMGISNNLIRRPQDSSNFKDLEDWMQLEWFHSIKDLRSWWFANWRDLSNWLL